MVVDVTECAIQTPNIFVQRVFYSGKSKQHSLKYEVGVELSRGTFVWFYGGCPGSYNDLTILRQSSLLDRLEPGEFLLGDKIYVGEPQVLTAFKAPQTEMERTINSVFYRHRIIVENSFARIKTFNFTHNEWRHDLKLHSLAFKVLLNVLNIDFETRPIRKNKRKL